MEGYLFSSYVNYVERIAYNAKGQQLLVAYGNGIMTRFLYRTDNFRLLRLKSEKYTKSGLTYTSNSGIKQNYSYAYDLSGNIINISDTTANCGYGTTPDALSRKFIYDALYRLLSATGRETAATGTTPWDDLYRPENESLARGYTQQYSYDKLGNIQSLQHIATSGNFTRSFDYGSFTKNALQKITIGSNVYHFAYDVNGNMLSEGDTARHLEYDCADRLRCFYVQTGSSEPSKYTHYLYDGAGNRVKKITRKQGGKYTATTYIDGAFEYTKESTGFDGIPNLKIGTWKIGSYSNGGEQNILHLMGGATRRIGASLGDSTPAIKYTLSDHLGSSCVQLDTSGTTVSLEEYYPFGETSFGSYAKKRYRFCGKEKDEESGLYYYGMRYYSPWTCRFINVDPLAGKFPFYTPYQYAGNKPINAIDLDGMEDKKVADTGGQEPQSNSDSTKKADNSQSNQSQDTNNIEDPVTTVDNDGKTKTTTTTQVIEENGVKIKVTSVKEEYKYYRGSNGEIIKTNLPEGKNIINPIGLEGINDKSPSLGGDSRIKMGLAGKGLIDLEVKTHVSLRTTKEPVVKPISATSPIKDDHHNNDKTTYVPVNETIDINFLSGSAAQPPDTSYYDDLISRLQQNPLLKITIIGSIQSDEPNYVDPGTNTFTLDEISEQQKMKQDRANMIKNYMIKKDKTLASRITTSFTDPGVTGSTQAIIKGKVAKK